MQKSRFNVALSLVLTVAICLSFVAFLPTMASAATSVDSYYSGITATEGTQLLGQLHDLITTTHTRYTSYDDCKKVSYVQQTDAGSNSNSIMDFYSQSDLPAIWDSGKTWNREHVWCQSLSNGLWGQSGGGSDMHHIRPLDSSLNSTRGNNKFGETNGGTAKYTASTGALGGYLSGGVFEPLDQVKGDVARIVMYVYTHYNTYSNVYGTTNGNGGSGTFGTLHFTNVISASSESVAIEMLLDWNRNDPVDSIERNRNDAVYNIQGNRNPFVDNEAFADAIWGGQSLQTDPLQSLQMNYSQLTLSTQQTMALKVTATPSNANSRVTWSSSNSNVASVSSAGVVTGVSAGTATITATSVENSSITAKCTVTVKGITNISVSGTPSKTTYMDGEKFDPTGLTVTATYNDGTSATLPLSSCKWLDGTTQTENLSQGTTSVLCKVGNLTATVNGITVKADTSVPQPVDMTNLKENTPYKLTMKQGNKGDIILYIKNEVANTYYMASTETPSEADDVYVQKVSGGFYLYFLNGSTKNYLNAEVSGTHVNLVSKTSATSVWQYDTANKCIKTAVTVSGSATEAYIGTYNYYITFSTSTIDHISGSFPAYLTAFSDEPTPPTPDSVTLDRTNISLNVGETATLTATANGSVSWSTSNSAVATVSSSGKVTAVGKGTATITATCGTAKATCTVTVTESPIEDFVRLNQTSLTLEAGATATLTATASGSVSWKTSNSAVATVSNSGRITAVGKGTATITATCGTAKATCTVIVTEQPIEDFVTLNITSLTLEVGATATLTATASGSVKWTTSDSRIAIVMSNGKVTAVGRGTVTITATCGTAKATCTVTVTTQQIEDSVTLNQTSLTLEAGKTATLTATATGEVVWTSSDESVATVSNSGLITAVGSGTATITATCGTATATCSVTVTETPIPDSVTLDQTSLTLEAGKTAMLNATATGAVVWTSSDENVATVSNNGEVTAGGSGTATITATCGTATATCTVTVTEPPIEDSVTLNQTSLTLEAGKTAMLNATATGAVVWTSSDESIATVSSSGRITAVSMGTVTITATCGTATATCTVTVTEETSIAAFSSAVAQAEQATAFDVKYQALQQAISAYSNLSQNAKDSVKEDYAKLQNAVNSYNQTAARYNADMNSALSTVLTTAVTLGLAAAALVVLLKQKLL